MKIQKVKQNGNNAKNSKNSYVQIEYKSFGAPKGIRIPVPSLKGWCPRPLDDGGTLSKDKGGGPQGRTSPANQTLYSYFALPVQQRP